MSYVDLTPTFVPTGHASDVERSAVIQATNPASKLDWNDTASTFNAYGNTLALWWKTLDKLKAVSWRKFDNQYLYNTMRYCTPAGIATTAGENGTYKCDQVNFCPWCWGRRAGCLYRELVNFINTDPIGFDMYLLGRSFILEHVTNPDTLEDSITYNAKAFVDELRRTVAAFKSSYSYRVVSISPIKRKRKQEDSDDCSIIYRERGLVIVPHTTKLSRACIGRITHYKLRGPTQDNMYINPTVKDLKYAASTVFRYPRGLLLADPVVLIPLLRARSALRLTAEGGNMNVVSSI